MKLWASPVTLVVKNLLDNAVDTETLVQSLSWEDSMEEGMAAYSSICGLPWWLR